MGSIQTKMEGLAMKIQIAFRHRSFQKANNNSKHYLLVKYGYLLFYVMIIVVAITGLGLAYEDVPYLKSIRNPIIQVHSVVQYLIYFYLIVHLAGFIKVDTTVNKGFVSRMIDGDMIY